VRHQVKYLGLLENVRVRRAGFAYRQEYERFFRRYKMLSKKCWPKWRDTPRAGTELLVKEHNIKDDEFRLGKTKVLPT
jgi:myosin-1